MPDIVVSSVTQENAGDKSSEVFENGDFWAELQTIVSSLNDNNPFSHLLFRGIYQVLLLDSPLSFLDKKKVVALCYGKPIQRNVEGTQKDSVFSENGGSPLEVVFEELKFTHTERIRTNGALQSLSHSLHPMKEFHGTKLLAQFCQLTSSRANEITSGYPLVTICYKNSNRKAFLMKGMRKETKLQNFFLENRGSVSSSEQIPKISSITETHLAGFSSKAMIDECSAFARYDFLGYKTKKGSELKPVAGANVTVECQWQKPKQILEPIDAEAICIAKITSILGDEESGAFNKFMEIKLVEALYQSLQTGSMAWIRRDSNILARVNDFMKSEQAATRKKEKMAVVITEFDYFDHAVMSERGNLDFTDKLWNILKDCSSFEELSSAFSIVYSALSNFSIVPFVNKKNTSRIALFIKNMSDENTLSEVLPIELLLEIGIEKLRKDYMALFFGLELVPFDSVDRFLSASLNSEEAIINLKKLHSVLELAIVCLKHLKLPKPLISNCMRSALNNYAQAGVDLNRVFELRVPAVKIRTVLNQMRPVTWELCMSSTENDFTKRSIYRYVTSASPENIYAPKDYNPKLLLPNAIYTELYGLMIENSNG